MASSTISLPFSSSSPSSSSSSRKTVQIDLLQRWYTIFEELPDPEIYAAIYSANNQLFAAKLEQRIVELVNDTYLKYLNRPPDKSGFDNSVKSLLSGGQTAAKYVLGVERSDERRGLLKALAKMRTSPSAPIPEALRGTLRIKYIGHTGDSGYAKAARLYVEMLIHQGAIVYFQSLNSVQETVGIGADLGPIANLLSSGLGTEIYDTVVVHTVPAVWKPYVDYERKRNPKVRIVGNTVWESSDVHQSWSQPLSQLDALIVPSEWNREIFAKVTRCPIYVVQHPIPVTPTLDSAKSVKNETEKNKTDRRYTFYSINEWNGRKSISELVLVYLTTFTSKDHVVLVLKTNTKEITRDEIDRYIARIVKTYSIKDPAEIRLVLERLSDIEIAKLHQDGDCYVSLHKGEGVGLGIITARALGKTVISTNYGGTSEYISGDSTGKVHWVDHKLIPAVYCFDTMAHESCDRGSECVLNPWYDPKTQQWAEPNLATAATRMRSVYDDRVSDSQIADTALLSRLSVEELSKKLARCLKTLSPP
jgi:hypothetical protein